MTTETNYTAREPVRPDPERLSTAALYRKDPNLVEAPLKRNDALQLVIEARAAGFDYPERLTEAADTAITFVTLLAPQARAAVLVAAEDVANARNDDTDGRAVRKAVRDGYKGVSAIKLSADRVAKAEVKLSQAERLEGAVRREERKARAAYHNELRRPEAVDAWREAWASLYVDEAAEAYQELTFRQATQLKAAQANARPLLEALYGLSLGGVTPRERARLKVLFAQGGPVMPTLEQVRAEAEAAKAASPAEVEARERAERKRAERAANKEAGVLAAASRLQRSDATVPK